MDNTMALIITVGAIVAGSLVVLSGVQTGSNTKLIVPPITNYTQGYEYAKQEFYGANISCPFELSGKLTGPIPKQGNKYGEGAVKYQDRTIGYMNSLECNKIFRDENGKVKGGQTIWMFWYDPNNGRVWRRWCNPNHIENCPPNIDYFLPN